MENRQGALAFIAHFFNHAGDTDRGFEPDAVDKGGVDLETVRFLYKLKTA